MLISWEVLVQSAANAIDQVWEAEWRRNDFFFYLTKALTDNEIKALMNQIGRSHQDAYRWSKASADFPPGSRRLDRSPRDHRKEANRAVPKAVRDIGADVEDSVEAPPKARSRARKVEDAGDRAGPVAAKGTNRRAGVHPPARAAAHRSAKPKARPAKRQPRKGG